VPRFFIPADALHDGRAVIVGADAFHLAKSLRAQAGEEIVVVDSRGVEHGVVLDAVAADAVAGPVRWSRPATGEPRLRLHVLQALPRDGMEIAIDAMVQAGATSIRPVVTERTIARPDAARASRRLERWQAVAREAAGLAGRGAIPVVTAVAPLEAAITALPPDADLIVCAWEAATPLASTTVDGDRDIAVVIGPEGGLSAGELALLDAANARRLHLGARVLRARLAGAMACMLLLSRARDLDSGPQFAPVASSD